MYRVYNLQSRIYNCNLQCESQVKCQELQLQVTSYNYYNIQPMVSVWWMVSSLKYLRPGNQCDVACTSIDPICQRVQWEHRRRLLWHLRSSSGSCPVWTCTSFQISEAQFIIIQESTDFSLATLMMLHVFQLHERSGKTARAKDVILLYLPVT